MHTGIVLFLASIYCINADPRRSFWNGQPNLPGYSRFLEQDYEVSNLRSPNVELIAKLRDGSLVYAEYDPVLQTEPQSPRIQDPDIFQTHNYEGRNAYSSSNNRFLLGSGLGWPFFPLQSNLFFPNFLQLTSTKTVLQTIPYLVTSYSTSYCLSNNGLPFCPQRRRRGILEDQQEVPVFVNGDVIEPSKILGLETTATPDLRAEPSEHVSELVSSSFDEEPTYRQGRLFFGTSVVTVYSSVTVVSVTTLPVKPVQGVAIGGPGVDCLPACLSVLNTC